MTEIKYPDQVRVIKRKNKNISVRFALGRFSEESGESPLDMPGYSRFIMSILKTEGGVQATTANIPQEELPNIDLRTKNAIRMMMERMWMPKTPASVATQTPVNNNSVEKKAEPVIPNELYQPTFGFPTEIRGKNVVQAYKEGFWDKVVGQVEILKRNSEKYPANKKLVEAIEKMDAIVRSGALDNETTMPEPEPVSPTELSIPIYETEMKYFSSQRGDGKNKIYQISIVCLPDNKYPFKVTIVNGYADVVNTSFGGKNITNVVDRVYLDIYLSEAEWSNMVDRMMEISRNYEILEAGSRFELVKKYSYKNKYQQ